jgi:hypothetical protein
MFHQHNGDIILHRIDTAAFSAGQGTSFLVVNKVSFALGATKDVKKLFPQHGTSLHL